MTGLNRRVIETFVRQIVTERLMPTEQVDSSGIMSTKLLGIDVTENGHLNTSDPAGVVYAKDLFSLEESPCLGYGLTVVKDTTFDWTLEYDEADYIISEQLNILVDERKISATAGEIVLIPKNSGIQLSVTGDTRFVYVTYPAGWQSQ